MSLCTLNTEISVDEQLIRYFAGRSLKIQTQQLVGGLLWLVKIKNVIYPNIQRPLLVYDLVISELNYH